MNLRKTIVASCGALVLSMLACNIGAKAPTALSPRDAAGTIVAQTLQAQGLPTSAGQVLNSPAPQASPAASPTASPIAVINRLTYCRNGPGENYKSVTDVNAGQRAPVVGKDASGNYWLIQSPAGVCWMDAQYVVIMGNTQNLPEVTPEAANAGAPVAPVFQKQNGWTYNCRSAGQADITLSWIDRADNETGYRIYRNSNVVAELPANSTSYVETITLLSGQSVSYQVEAYNSYGAARSGVATMACP